MSTTATLRAAEFRAADGTTLPQLATAMKANLDVAMAGCMTATAREAMRIINHEGHRFYVRARKTRKPIRLSSKLGPHSAKAAIVYGVPVGFWAIVEQGSKAHRIERKLAGRGKNRRAQLLGRKDIFGPTPYALHPGHGSQGHPWAIAMVKVNQIPNNVFDSSIDAAFKGIFKKVS